VLSGANTYAGGTKLNSGTARVGVATVGTPGAITSSAVGTGMLTFNGGTLQAGGAYTVANAATINSSTTGTIDNNGFAFTYSGAIGGSGNLTVANSSTGGSLTLTNSNGYAGATAINSGATLALSGSGSIASSSGVADNGTFSIGGLSAGTSIVSLSGSGTVTLGGNTLTLSNASGTFSGGVGGTGGLTLATGTETLSGNNGYSGATTVNGGTLALSGSGSISLSSGVADNGTFDISQTASGATIATLSGSGTVTLGGNILTLSNASGTFSGGIGGAGGLAQTAGTETLSGASTYSGGTTLNGGTIVIGASSAGSPGAITSGPLGTGTLAMAAGTTLSFLNSNFTIANKITVTGDPIFTPPAGTTQTLSGVISNATPPAPVGIVDMNGGGTLVLNATNTYTGATNVNSGTLEVDGSIATSSLTTVASGATLQGTGIVGNLQINSGGSFAPGAVGGAGTSMTVSGNLALQSGILYVTQVSPASATFTNVTGTASLNGTVLATFATGAYLTRNYVILQSSGLGGTTFGALDTLGLPKGFTASLMYTTDDVVLHIVGGLAPAQGLTINQSNVYTAVNNFFNSGGAVPPGFTTLFGLSSSALPAALTQLDGEAATGGEAAVFQSTSEFLSLLLNPFVNGRPASSAGAIGFALEEEASLPPDIALAYASVLTKAPPPPQGFDPRWTTWGAAYGGTANISGDSAVVGSTNLSASTYGFAAGMDYRVAADSVVGFGLAGGGTNWNLQQALGGGRSDEFQAGVYGTHYFGPAYVAAALSTAANWMHTSRTSFAGDELTASFNAQSYGARVESGYRYAPAPAFGVTPYGALQLMSFHTPSYSETDLTGGGFGLNYNAQTATDARSELGARFSDLTSFNGMPLTLRARLAWAHDWVSDPSLTAVFQGLPGASFVVNGAPLPHNSALTSAGAELKLSTKWTLLSNFDGEFARGAETYSGTGTLRYAW
jgi:autotransporter-associated beta strand protein